MKKLKILKMVLPLIGIAIFAAAAVWLQGAGWIGDRADPPEDALHPDPAGRDFAEEDRQILNGAVLDEAAAGRLPEELQKLDEASVLESGTEGAGRTMPALSTQDLPLRDLYGASGQTVRFHVYHPGAVNYVWEYYDMELKEWLPEAGELAGSERDALGRMTAYADFETPGGQPELMIRCIYGTGDAGGQVSEMAFLRALPQEIRQLALADESIGAEAGSCLAAWDIAVKAVYADGSSDVIDGLYGLYFMQSEAEAGPSEFILADGVLTERKVQTSLDHFCPYCFVPAGSESITLAYMPDAESQRLELSGTVTGTDEEPPVVSQVDILAREDVPGTEGEISMTILVTAEDNVTPYPRLQYAIKEAGAGEAAGETAEGDWIGNPRISMTMKEGGAWFLYCRDQEGNVTVYQYEDPPEEPPALAEKLEEPPDGEPEDERDTQAPVIRNIYVEAD